MRDKKITEYLVFESGEGRWAVPSRVVERIVRLDAITPVPLAPSFLMGLTNLTGSAITVIDLGGLISEATGWTAWRTRGKFCILVTEGGLSIGLAAKKVYRVVRVVETSLLPVEHVLSTATIPFEGQNAFELDLVRVMDILKSAIDQHFETFGKPGVP